MITSATSPADSGASSAAASAAEGPALVAWYAEGFSDRLGDRLRLFDNATTPLELLRFSAAVTGTPGFESSLRIRLTALASFRHPAFALIRSLTVLDDPKPQLALVSELATGERLSAVLQAAQSSGVRLDATSAIWLLRHLLPALAAFHDATGGIQHGWLDPDRVVVGIDAQRRAVERTHQGVSNLGVGAGRHQGGRLAARHFLRKTGTAEHPGLQPGRHGGLDLVTKQAR